MNQEQINIIRLWRTARIGPATFHDMILHFGSATEAVRSLPERLDKVIGSIRFHLCSVADVEREIEALSRVGGQMLTYNQPEFPQALRHCADGPPVISILGHRHLLDQPCVAVVGSRRPSWTGRKITAEMVSVLGAKGYTVVSGLARGIDTVAHEKSLTTGTVAVVAGGVSTVYPPQNKELYDQICRSGLIVSERALSTPIDRRGFPRRNRLISGLSRGCVIIEAARGSGSLISARSAAEQGREVYVVPGSPEDARYAGSNQLIRSGAILVNNGEDIIESLCQSVDHYNLYEKDKASEIKPQVNHNEKDIQVLRQLVLDCLSPTPIHADHIIQSTGLTPSDVQYFLSELEIAGRLVRYAGGTIALEGCH